MGTNHKQSAIAEEKICMRGVKQIIAANDWKAVFYAGSSGEIRIQQLAAWALTENAEGEQRIVGINKDNGASDATNNLGKEDKMVLSEDNINFLGYAHSNEDITELSDRAIANFDKK